MPQDKIKLSGQVFNDSLIWDNPYFPNQSHDEEDVILVVREDVAILAFRMVKFVAAFIFLLFIKTISVAFIELPIVSQVVDIIFGLSNCIMVVLSAITFHNYYLSLQIVTSKRIIDVDQTSLFRRETNELAITNIQDVTHKQRTFWETFFNFGNVIVRTSGGGDAVPVPGENAEINGFVFNSVPSPSNVANLVSKVYHTEREKDQEGIARINAEYISRALK